MAHKILLHPILFPSQRREKPRLRNLFNTYFLQLPHGFQGKKLLRKLFRLWARNEGIPTEEWDKAEGVWGFGL